MGKAKESCGSWQCLLRAQTGLGSVHTPSLSPSLPQTPIFLGFAAVLVIAAEAQQLTALQCWASAPPKFPANPEPPAPTPLADLSLAFPHASSPVTFFLYGANRLIKGFL